MELPDGVIALVGRNGAGKSTFLEAIGWCLYGHEAARTAKDLLKWRGAAASDDVRVHLAFRLGPHHYEVTRELLGRNETHVATVKVGGRVVVPAGAQSQREATAYVTRLFHMDREAFFTSLVARQRELAALSDAKPADRKRLLIGLLRLDALDDAIALARQRKRDARTELTGLRAATKDPAPLREALSRLLLELQADETRLREADAGIVALVDEVEAARERREAGRKLAEEHRLGQTHVANARERVALTQRERERRALELARVRESAAQAALIAPSLARLQEVRERCESLATLRMRHEELARVRSEAQKALAEHAAAQAEVARAGEALASAGAVRSLAERVQRERPRLEGVLQEAQRLVGELAARMQETARALHEAETKEKRVRQMGPESPCPTCTRPLREHYGELLHDFEGQMEALRAALAQAAPQLDEATRREAEAKRGLQALAEREQELRVKMAAAARDEAVLAAASARAAEAAARAQRHQESLRLLAVEAYDAAADEAARRELKALEAVRERHARLAADAEREPDLARLVDECVATETVARTLLAEAETRLGALGFDADAHAALEKAAQAAQQRLSDARVARERLLIDRTRRQEEEKRMRVEIDHHEALAAKARELEGRVLLLEQLAGDREAGLLPEFKDHLIGRVRPVLSLHAGRLFRDLTEGRYADLEVAEDYSLRIQDEGETFALERFSGGEADLANLCLRLAVSQVVAERAGTEGFGFLALDEIFGSQDEVRKGNILRGLKALGGRFRQILLVTHIADVKDAAEHVLRVEAVDDGTSRVVVE